MKKMISLLLVFSALFIIGCSNDTSDTVIPEEETTTVNEKEEEVDEAIESTEEDEGIELVDPSAFVSFEGVDFSGNDVSNDIFMENELTLINVWGTNCGPCLDEIPYLQELNDELADEGFQVIGFLTGGESYKEEGVEILDMLDADYMNLIIPEEVFSKLGIQYIPTSFLVDKEGKVVEKRIVGALTKEAYLEKINKYLE